MARVLLIDYPNFRTTRHWRDYLAENHELETDMYADPEKMAWADVIWMEWCEYAAILASKGVYNDETCHFWNDSENRFGAGNSRDWRKSKLFIRPIDIDIHAGHFRGVDWTRVQAMCYIAPHFREMLMDGMQYPPGLRIEETRLSVKLDEWVWRSRGPGKNIAWMNENWSAKNLPAAIYALHRLVRYEGWSDAVLHVVSNGRSGENWLHRHVRHMVRYLGLEENVRFYDSVPSVDKFLDDKDFLWHTGMKEGFSLICGEALAKGIKVLMLNWESSKEIWPEELVCDTPEILAARTAIGGYDSAQLRSYAERYSHDKEIANLRRITGL